MHKTCEQPGTSLVIMYQLLRIRFFSLLSLPLSPDRSRTTAFDHTVTSVTCPVLSL